jgi:EmrB/QacA subfamily drug resistance transporter
MTTTTPTESSAPAGGNKSSVAVLIVVSWTLFFGVLNASAIGVVLPSIADDLGTDIGRVSWIMTGFLLVYGVAIPFYGRLADLYGARRLFILGLGLFALGSLLSAVAPNFETLLASRILQAVGGAAAPGLGMAIASRAFGPESRGMVIGIIGAVIGIGSAIGPLLGGLLASTWGWESIFVFSAVAAVAIPAGLKVLPRDEGRVEGHLDIVGGLLLALLVVGVLIAPSQASQNGWSSGPAIGGVALAVVSLVLFVFQQRRATSPFIPAEFRRNTRFIALVAMSFLLMAANAGLLIGLPILLAIFNQTSVLTIGLVMLPGAVLSAISGVVAGRFIDRFGAPTLMKFGGAVMLIGIVGLSAEAGGSLWLMSAYAGFIGAGLGFVNTPLATTVTRIVPAKLLSSALDVNSMLFFVGGSVGAAILLGFSTAAGTTALNPLFTGKAVGFSDGFLVLALPVLLIILLSSRASGAGPPVLKEKSARQISNKWTADCSVPWAPEIPETNRPAAAPVVSEGN